MIASDSLPKVKSGGAPNKKLKAGWSENVKPFQQKNQWWHWMWVQAGRPRSGIVYEYMKEARRQYRYAVRRIKRDDRIIRYQKMASDVAEDNGRNFFC